MSSKLILKVTKLLRPCHFQPYQRIFVVDVEQQFRGGNAAGCSELAGSPGASLAKRSEASAPL